MSSGTVSDDLNLVTVLVGDDIRRTNSLRRHRDLFPAKVEHLDAVTSTIDEITTNLATPSLFGPQRHFVIDNVDTINAEHLKAVLAAALAGGHRVILSASTLNAAQKKQLPSTVHVEELPAVDVRRGGLEQIGFLAAERGITLNAAAKRLLLERVGHDSARLNSILTQCKLGQLLTPTLNQLERLCGTSAAAGVPWELGDRLETGDTAGAVAACADAIPLATLAYLSNRYLQVLRILEADATTGEAAAEASGQKNVYTAQRLQQLGRRVGRANIETVLRELAAGDLLCKQHDRDGLRIVIGKIAPLFAPR